MDKKQRDKKLEELAKSGYTKALLEFIEEKLQAVNTIEGCKSIEEVVGRQWAVKYLKDLFRFLERKGETKEEKSKNEYL